jgi:hypothetical protein
MSQGGRKKLEMQWQTRLEQAARRHGMATVRCLRIMERYDQPSRSAECMAVILRAIRKANAARVEHMRVLGIFADIMSLGRLPRNRTEGSAVPILPLL